MQTLSSAFGGGAEHIRQPRARSSRGALALVALAGCHGFAQVAASEDDREQAGSDTDLAPSECAPSQPVSGCDPVRATGCPPLMQCDINVSAKQPTGRCVFPQPTTPTPACMSSFVGESCESQWTCVNSTCRKLCYCDADCPSGECCSDESGPGPQGVFKLCEPC